LLVKRKGHVGSAKVLYRDIGDYLTREQKLDIVTSFGSYKNMPWTELQPNAHHDWINQRSGDFNAFVPFNDESSAIFAFRSRGVETSRDDWAYNASEEALAANIGRLIDFYNAQLEQHRAAIQAVGSAKDKEKKASQLIDTNAKKIKWTRGLIAHLARDRKGTFDAAKIGKAAYRPFCQSWIYYDQQFNEYFKEKLYPSAHHKNLVIVVPGPGEDRPFSALVTNALPNLHLLHGGQCFPLHWYEKAGEQVAQAGLSFDEPTGPAEVNGYVRKDGITDVALANFRKQYGDQTITKEAIFYYCYGVLHSPEYREHYAADLKKVLPRVPYAPDFKAFEKAGRDLAKLHLDYETVEPWPVTEEAKPKGDLNDLAYYRIEKMRFASKGGREKDRSVIVFNSRITVKGIPEEAYDYMVNGKSAIEWVMDRYQVTKDKVSAIVDDPNDWCREHNDPAYILNLLKRVIRVSMETVKIVGGLPSIQ
jgi:predicted helicase